MPLNQSFGVFPSTSLASSSSSPNLTSKLWFSTTSQEQLTGQPLKADDRNDTFYDVLELGHKNTKHMKFPRNRAPLMDRANGSLNVRDFTPPSFEDFSANRRLATLVKGSPKPIPSPWMGEATSYAGDFRGPAGEDLRDARQPAQGSRRGRTNTLSGTGHSWVATSHSQNQHRGPVDGHPIKPEIAVPRHHLTTVGPTSADHYRTQFRRDFVPPSTEVGAEAVPQDVLMPAHMVPTADSRIFTSRRLPCMSPGM